MRRGEHFERSDFAARGNAQRLRTLLIWPIAESDLRSVGQSVMHDRNGMGRPHKGIDLFAAAGTAVHAACGARVLRVMDGRQHARPALRRAGLFVDLACEDLVLRYLHLGEVWVAAGESVTQGRVLGTVAAPFTSGLGEVPHLHFEVRAGDYDATRQDYGPPIDPLRLLPARRT